MLYMCAILLLDFYFYCVALIVDYKHGHAILFVILCCCHEFLLLFPVLLIIAFFMHLVLAIVGCKKGSNGPLGSVK